MHQNIDVARLREARKSPSVLKTKLALTRSKFPTIRIVVFEGQDDKIVYSQWIRDIEPGFEYEPMVCGGKRGVRGLKNLCVRDRTELGRDVLFIVDHDFDGLDGFTNTEEVYCTSTYSFENHLVCTDVLNLILRDEFPCDGHPEIRASICETFRKDYVKFIEVSRSFNYRLYLARRLGIELDAPIPSSLTALARVRYDDVTKGNKAPSEVIQLSRRPSGAEVGNIVRQFLQLDGHRSYRGKFALKFFKAWLRELRTEYQQDNRGIFDGVEGTQKIQEAEWTLSSFAAKSRAPDCFRAFVIAHN
ncbi:MAG: hypothetical protein COA41_09595 [Sphingopyxis sp.]|nr:MAG: hypothetical protein COA41_09595 [Sphingopyxis sp.]